MPRRTFIWFAAALIVFALLAGLAANIGGALLRLFMPAHIAPDTLYINPVDSYTFSENIDGSLVIVTGGDIALTGESQVDGNVSLIGNNITIAGVIDGDLSVAGHDVTIADGAQIDSDVEIVGDSVTVAGQIDGNLMVTAEQYTIAESARIDGSIVTCTNEFAETPTRIQNCYSPHMLEFSPLSGIFAVLTLSGIGALAVTVFPRQIGRIQEAIIIMPRRLGVLGFIALMASAGVIGLFTLILAAVPPVGLLLAPVAALGMIALGLMLLSGWITLSLIVGDLLLRGILRLTLPALLEVMVGGSLILLILYLLSLIPFGTIAGTPLMIVLASVGLGAAIRTRFGTRPLRGARLVQG